MVFENFYLDCFAKIFAAFLSGLILGFERKTRRHPVGIRTLVLISISSAILGILSVEYAKLGSMRGDPSRIASGVITGIGFLGTGVIIKSGLNIKGLTSASVVWAASAFGLTCGIGLYSICALGLVFCIFTLFVLDKIETRLFPAEKTKKITLMFDVQNVDLTRIEEILKQNGLIQRDLNLVESLEKEKLTLIFSVKSPNQMNVLGLTSELRQIENLSKIIISDE